MAKALDSDIEVNNFELKSRNYFYFRTNLLEKIWTTLSYQLGVK